MQMKKCLIVFRKLKSKNDLTKLNLKTSATHTEQVRGYMVKNTNI